MALDPYCMIVVRSPGRRENAAECFEEGADFVFDKSSDFERAIATAEKAARRQTARSPRRPLPRRSISEEFVLANKSGLHVLPAARLVKLANEYRAAIEIVYEGRKANAKNLMEVLALGAECGARIAVTAAGADAAQTLAGIRSLVAKKFHDAIATDRSSRR
jgi:phosphotransferase system HPr (HPr) family protein